MTEVHDEKLERWQRAADLASEVIEESRVQLMLKFKFLDLALWRMPVEPVHVRARYALATDGHKVYVDPELELARFSETPTEAIRDYLHLVMHCIFRHPYDRSHRRPDAWWLACDVIAENSVIEMCGGRFASPEDETRDRLVSELKMTAGSLAPGRLCAFFEKVLGMPEGADYRGYTAAKLNTLRSYFERDNHEAWPSYVDNRDAEQPGDVQELGEQDDSADEEATSDGTDLKASGEMDASEGDDQRSSQDDGDNEGAGQAEGGGDSLSDQAPKQQEKDLGDSQGQQDADAQEDGSASGQGEERSEEQTAQDEKDWEEIAREIEMNLETFSKEWGDQAGALVENLEIARRKTTDFTEFLRRFATVTEEVKLNPDEFDYLFYLYGMKLYGNMPLIEPLEYKDTKRIHDFCIVIDTSESVKGDLVRMFLEHTFEILKESEDWATRVNIHLIQADAKVQADTKITDLRDVDHLMENFYLRGFGGTDFRPAFDYIDQLTDRGEFEDLKGLIYFTDGKGRYPDKVPSYETAFVFLDTGEPHLPNVPPWAMRVIVDERSIRGAKSNFEVRS